MSEGALAITTVSGRPLQKSKPRYTEAENKILFESWWHPQQRRELVTRLGRKMSALRSQFCRLLKEKGLTNQDYYNMMQSKYTNELGIAPRKRSRELKDVDRLILEIFCKHQALGNSRALACDELQHQLGSPLTPAALKLRFYRLVKRLQYEDEDLVKIGNQVLGMGQTPINNEPEVDFSPHNVVKNEESVVLDNSSSEVAADNQLQTNETRDNSFFYQLSSLPTAISDIDLRLHRLEESQRHQLDLRGFIEHLLAVERDLKREDKLMEEIQRLMDENENFHNQLGKERERLKKREDELGDVYKMLDSILSDFMRLESVSKLASLGDFMHRLEITVDQFGNVLKSKRVVPNNA
jgi:molecular chaperone GrpE (heat shock protein)